MTSAPKSLPDLYRRWYAVFAFNKHPGETEDEFDARVDAASDERHALEHEIAATPATQPSDIALKLKAVKAFEGEFRYVGPTEEVLDSAIADLERLDERAPGPESDPVLALCDEWRDLDARVKWMTASEPYSTAEGEKRVTELRERREGLFDRIAGTEPWTLAGFLAQLAVARAELGVLYGTSDGGVDLDVEATWRVLGYAERFHRVAGVAAEASIDERDAALIAAEDEIARAYEELKTAPDSDAEREVIWKRVDAAENTIATAMPASLTGVAVKLRRILHSVDINDGNLCTRDGPSLARVLEFVISFRGEASPKLVALCERFRALVEAYNSGDASRDDDGPDPAWDELQGVLGTIATFEARCAADVALKIRAEELNDDADYAELAEKGDSAGRALTRALADLDRLAREGGGR
jgi:hypothetical protein